MEVGPLLDGPEEGLAGGTPGASPDGALRAWTVIYQHSGSKDSARQVAHRAVQPGS